jgi:hypothetical protein
MGLLTTQTLQNWVTRFTQDDHELYKQHIPNEQAFDFLAANIPLLDCPDRDVERTYYFRWWTYRKHIKSTPGGFVITEFLPPVPWAGPENTVNLLLGQHIREGRWLRDGRYISDYLRFWCEGRGRLSGLSAYTSWPAFAVRDWTRVSGRVDDVATWLPDLVRLYETWETGWDRPRYGAALGQILKVGRHGNGLFAQSDVMEGSEFSLGGSGFTVFTNAARCGEATAIAWMARHTGREDIAAKFQAMAEQQALCIRRELWHPALDFYTVRRMDGTLADVRELWGFMPWYFGIPNADRAAAWDQLGDPAGFKSPRGLTFPERRHPGFCLSYEGHECQWNGPVWPMATSLVLTALIQGIQNGDIPRARMGDFFEQLVTYARCHALVREDGHAVSWIDENLHPDTGDWIARTRLRNDGWLPAKGGVERGKDYNHSTFADLVITGLAGLCPREDDRLVIDPLLPAETWEYFALDGIPYRGSSLTVAWDRTGERYGIGAGFRVWVDGVQVAVRPNPDRVEIPLA